MLVFGLIMGALMTLVMYMAYIVVFAFTLWMAVDAGKQDRFWWIVLILGIPFIGSIVYYFTEKKHEYAKAEPHHVHDSLTESQHEKTPVHHRRKHQEELPVSSVAGAQPDTVVQEIESTQQAEVSVSQSQEQK